MTDKEKKMLVAVILFPFKAINKILDLCAAGCWALSQHGAEQEYAQWKYGTGRYSKD